MHKYAIRMATAVNEISLNSVISMQLFKDRITKVEMTERLHVCKGDLQR